MSSFHAEFSNDRPRQQIVIDVDASFVQLYTTILMLLRLMAKRTGEVAPQDMFQKVNTIRVVAARIYSKTREQRKDKNVSFATLDELIQPPTAK